jgi:cephalosporin-C deacetylase
VLSDPNLQPYLPEDFDQFWGRAADEAAKSRLDYARKTQTAQELPGFRIELIEFRDVSGGKLQGWIAIPRERSIRAPAFLWLPPYGRESSLPDEYSTRQGMVSMSFNFHGYSAFYKTPYSPSEGYFAEGVEDPNTWVFKTMAQNALIAARVLQAQIEADEDRIAVAGLSQGGGMAVWVGAHSKVIRCVVADLPFLSCMPYVFSKPVYRYPLKEVTDYAAQIPLGMERAAYTISYFDTVNHAARLAKPSLVSYGLKDPACRPETVRAVYEAISAPKRLIEYQGGHDWDKGMIATNRDWMLEKMNGMRP